MIKPIEKSYTLTEATKKLEFYCAYQERCHKEVIHKLKGMRMIPEAIDHIVTHLITNNYLNEERYTKAFVRGKFHIKKWGKKRLKSELKQRNISKYNIEIALKEIDETLYLNTLDALSRKRLASIKEKQPQKIRKKLADYLFYRGWESHLVYEKIKELVK